MTLDTILDDVTGIVAEVKPYMFETEATNANPSVSATEIDTLGILTPGANDEPDEEEQGKTDPELDGYINAWVKQMEAAVAAAEKDNNTCPCA